MKRILAFLALLLSLGVNVGFIAVWAIQRHGARRPAEDEPESPSGLRRLHQDIGVTDEQWQEMLKTPGKRPSLPEWYPVMREGSR